MISPKLKRSFFMKATSLLLALTFSVYNVSFAAVEKEPVQTEAVVQEAIADGPLAIEDIGIAIDTGTVKSSFSGDTGKVVIHIQDAHCNYEAQNNINKILDQLTKECGLNMISVEGAEGIVDTSWFRAFPDAEIRKEVATYFMKKGEITGAEFFSITTNDFAGTIFGAETREYYVKNLRAFTEVYPYKEQIENYFLNLRTIANRLKTIVYPPKLREVDAKIRDFKHKDIELSDYAEYLAKNAKKYRVDLKDKPNFEKLMQTLEYEDKIDFDIVDSERSDYIDLLSKKMDKEKMTELVTESVRFKKGHIKAVQFYIYLRDLAREYEIEIVQEYPNLFYYYIYTKLYDGINNEGLFREIGQIETQLKDKLFKNETERTLDKYTSLIDMYVDLVNIELTNDDYDQFNAYIADFNIDDVVRFINSLCDKYNLNYPTEDIPAQIRENIPNMVDFYEIAMKRDHALIDNTIKQMEKMAQDRCVLIAGGFHTRGIKDILEKQGISYVVVTPKITKDVETPYIKVLTNQRTSLEDIISESVAMPGVSPQKGKEAPQAAESFLGPVLRLFGIDLWLTKGAAAADKWQASIVAGGQTTAEISKDTFDEIVEMAVTAWIEQVRDSRQAQLINENGEMEGASEAAKEWNSLVSENAKWAVLLNRYLTLYRNGLEGQDEAFRAVAEDIKSTFFNYRKEKLEGGDQEGPATPGGVGAGGQVVEEDIARKIDDVIAASFQARTKLSEAEQKAYEVPADNIRKGFVFQLHDNYVENLMAEGLPVDIRPGRGGEVLDHKGLQAHVDKAVYEALTQEERDTVARHELAHLDIFNAEELAKNMDGKSLRTIRRAIGKEFGQDALATWDAWVKDGKPEGMAQEVFVNALPGCNAGAIQSRIQEIIADRVAVFNRKQAALEVKRQNLSDAKKIIAESEGVEEVIAITNGGDEGIVAEELEGLKTDIFRADGATKIKAHPEVTRRGQFLGLLDAMEAYREENGEFSDGVSLGIMMPGKGTRLSPLTLRLHGIKPLITMLIKAGREWLSGATASLYCWNLVANNLERMGFRGIAWKWGDEPQISANVLSEMDLDLSETDIVRFGSEVLVTDDLAENKEWLSADEDGNLVAQVRRRGRDELLERLGVENTPDARAMVHIGSPAFSYVFIEEAQKAFADLPNESWIDVDGYVVEALTQPKDLWDAEYDKEMTKAVTAVVKGYYQKGEPIDVQTIVEKLTPKTKIKKTTAPDTALRIQREEDLLQMQLWAKVVLTLQRLAQENAGIRSEKGDYFAEMGAWDRSEAPDRDEIKFKTSGIFETMWNCPDFYKRCQTLKENINARRGRPKDAPMNIKVVNFGEDLYWGDVGQLSKAREVFHDVNKDDLEGQFARELAGLQDVEKDEFGNTVVGKCYYKKDGSVRNSVLINTRIYGKANINNAVIVDSDLGNVSIGSGSVVYQSTVENLDMAMYAFSFRSIGEDVTIPENGVHTSMPEDPADASQGMEDWRVLATENPGSDNNYKNPIHDNPRSFEAQLAKMRQRGVMPDDIEADIAETQRRPLIDKMRNLVSREEYMKAVFGDPLRFGTSGMRDLVTQLTDYEVYVNARKFIRYMINSGEIVDGDTVYVAGDLRFSTDDIMTAVGYGIEQEAKRQGINLKVAFTGKVPSPAVSYAGFHDGYASVMVTGSHIPDDRNGIKFNKKTGEVLDEDVPQIKALDDAVRGEAARDDWSAAAFNELGLFKPEMKPSYDLTEYEDYARELYRSRYTDAFPADLLEGFLIAQYQHSSVGRDDLKYILEALGAKVVTRDRSDSAFVPVDTEKISEDTLEKLNRYASEMYYEDENGVWRSSMEPDTIDGDVTRELRRLDAMVSGDGDYDRPILADANGVFLPGDKLGLLVSLYLKPDFVAVPVSTNDAVIAQLEAAGIAVVQTKIGSPKVIKAMNDYLEQNPGAKVVAWEANGGFLLGGYVTDDRGNPILPGSPEESTWKVRGGTKGLTPLPTRDAILPTVSALALAKEEGKTLEQLIDEKLRHPDTASHRYNNAGVFDKFEEYFGIKGNPAFDLMKATVEYFSPTLEDTNVVEVDFKTGKAVRLLDADKIYTKEGYSAEVVDLSSLSRNDIDQWNATRDNFSAIYEAEGFAPLEKINILDGIRMTFANGEISHLRPSGNAPEFRNYSVADASEGEDVQKRAKDIVTLGVTKVIPAMVKQYMEEGKKDEPRPTPGIYAATDTRFAEAVSVLNSNIAKGLPIKLAEEYKTAKEGYDWGAVFNDNAIVRLLGDEKVAQLKKMLAAKYDIPESEVNNLPLGERWVSAGDVEVTLPDGSTYLLPFDILAIWGVDVFGQDHMDRYGNEIAITAKHLNSGRPLSVQYHRFDEMIIPMEKGGVAYVGFRENVTRDQVERALLEGTIQDLMNKVELEKGVPYIVPAFMVHAYGKVSVYEVKAVNSTQDKDGTESFYDRLKYMDEEGIKYAINVTASTLKDASVEERIETFTNPDGTYIIRPDKDILTKSAEDMNRIFGELEANGGFNATSEADLIYAQREVLASPDGSVYKIMGERGDFVSGKYEVKGTIQAHEDAIGKPHSLYVASGRIQLVKEGAQPVELNAGSERFIPAKMGDYEIVAVDGPAEVYTQYIPRAAYETKDGQEGETIPMPLEYKEGTIAKAVPSPAYIVRGVFDGYGVTEVIEINEKTDWKDKTEQDHSIPQIIDGREFTLEVRQEAVSLEFDGTPLTYEDTDETVYFEKGTKVMVYNDMLVALDAENGVIQEFARPEGVLDIAWKPESNGSAIVSVSYPKTDAEKLTYAVFRAVFNNKEAIFKSKQTFIYPEETFAPGSGLGSKQWMQGKMDEYFGEGRIEFRSYKAYDMVDGKKVARNLSDLYSEVRSYVDDAQKAERTIIFGAVQSAISGTETVSPEMNEILANVRVSAMPDMADLTGGWFFIQEAVGIGLLQAILNIDDIKNNDSVAQDVLKVMRQVSSPNLELSDLYTLLPFNAVDSDDAIPAEIKAANTLDWMRQLVQKLLLKMPVQPFNAMDQLEQRRRIMWSV